MDTSIIRLYGPVLLVLFKISDGECHVSFRDGSTIFPDNYDKHEPPWEKGNPAHVYIDIAVLDIDRIDDGKMEFSIQVYLEERWKDERINLSLFLAVDNGEKPIFPSYLGKEIWVPDLVFDNAKDGKLFHLSLPNSVIKVEDEGYIYKITRYNLIIGCHMDFHFYPMDTQDCYMKISSLGNPDSKVLLHWISEKNDVNLESIYLVFCIQPLKYSLKIPTVYKATEQWPDGNYSYLYGNFTFVRRLSGSVFNVYIPSTLIVILSWISFWIDIEAVPARVTLGVTSLLTLGTQVVQARAGLPDISYLTAMDVWLFACLLSVFCALVEFAFAYRFFLSNNQHCIDDDSNYRGRPRKTELKFLKSRLHETDIRNNSVKSRIQTNSYVENKENTKSIKFLDKVCRTAFPVAFGAFSVIYWVYYLWLK